MELPKDFWKQLPLKSDAQLLEMLARADDYLPEAIIAAKEELGRRDIPPEVVTQIEGKVQSEKLAESARADEPLAWPLRILIFLFCSGVLGVLLAMYYDNRGYTRKSKECWMTLFASLAFHVVMAVLILLTQ